MAEPLKNLYNEAFLNILIQDFQVHYSKFDAETFKALVFDQDWPNRELKDRMRHLSLSLHELLKMPFAPTMQLFKKVISQREGYSLERMLFPDYVEVFGQAELKESLDALAFFTTYASSEFAIRPFISQHQDFVLDRMMKWAGSDNFHLRRLASEGCRPRLPWAMALPALKKDPAPILPILEKLKGDETDYVRRSVANNLNDIAKDNPTITLEKAEQWIGKSKEVDWVVKHACRSLLKQGNTRALVLFGFQEPTAIGVSNLVLDKREVQIGAAFTFQFDLQNNSDSISKLRLEYIIDFVKKSGKISPKVFQITENTYKPGQHHFSKKQSFKDLTTRKHYPGLHCLRIIVNGAEKAAISFQLE
ncbi:MAG: DNA alkylation repair protein [Saprospiraceae bacterium]|nr:DNA alkylation repair protein [Saprospiraceae bacterium]